MKTLPQLIDEGVGENALRVLAGKLGVTPTQVCRWRQGKRQISIDMAVRLAACLGYVAVPQKNGTFLFQEK